MKSSGRGIPDEEHMIERIAPDAGNKKNWSSESLMTVYVDQSRSTEKSDEVIFRDERVRIQDHQIIDGSSIHVSGAGTEPAAVTLSRRFSTWPTHSFSIQGGT